MQALLLPKQGQREEYTNDFEQFSLSALLAFLPRPQRQQVKLQCCVSSLTLAKEVGFIVSQLGYNDQAYFEEK